MKQIITAGISAIVGLSVLGASLSTPAYAGKKERRVAVGVAIGAVTGLIIASELDRRAEKAHYRKKRRNGYRRENRRIRKHRRHQRRLRQQRERYYDDFDRYDRYNRYRKELQTDPYFDEYVNEPRREPRKKKRAGKQSANQNSGHIQRCIRAYRSYDPQSDTFIGYDGKERVCRK